jgi:KTSC domain-containing protein
MQRTAVQSSSLHSVGYENRVLEIRFHSGGTYQYFDVPAQVHQAFMAAPSKGRFFSERIRDAYRYARL